MSVKPDGFRFLLSLLLNFKTATMARHVTLWTLFVLMIFSVLLANTDKAHASHDMGADLTYGCLGPNEYIITLRMFRDCNGITPPNQYTVNYSSVACGITATLVLDLVPELPPLIVNPQDITPLCQGEMSACDGGGGIYGIEQWFYQATLTLPPGCGDDWVLSWTDCCRNDAITTLAAPGGQNMYIEAMLDNTLMDCNTSPQFTNPPTAFACIGQTVFYNHGVVDPDGDLLVFSLIDCLDNATTSVGYVPPFEGLNPKQKLPLGCVHW